ncbi:RalA-binding protein 1 [Blyttiomyces sp. JEL0837]|nr:RalA-binding protein 1 [Blyttiomyces sp. JEL0837]
MDPSSSAYSFAQKLANKSMAAAANLQERSVVWKEKAAELSADVTVKAKEAYAAAKKSEFVEKSAAYLAANGVIKRGDSEPDPTSTTLSSGLSTSTRNRKSVDSLGHQSGPSLVFGVPLNEVVERTKIIVEDGWEIPAVVVRCVEFIEQVAINEVGIYRVSGSASAVAYLKNLFGAGKDVDLSELSPDPNAVCSVLKSFLRDLPEPILTDALSAKFQTVIPGADDPSSPYNALAAATAAGPTSTNTLTTPDNTTSPSNTTTTSSSSTSTHDPHPTIDNETRSEIRSLTTKLPTCNSALLRYLCRHLYRIQERAVENKMSIGNLLVIFSPTLQISAVLLKEFILRSEGLIVVNLNNNSGGGGGKGMVRSRSPERLAQSEVVTSTTTTTTTATMGSSSSPAVAVAGGVNNARKAVNMRSSPNLALSYAGSGSGSGHGSGGHSSSGGGGGGSSPPKSAELAGWAGGSRPVPIPPRPASITSDPRYMNPNNASGGSAGLGGSVGTNAGSVGSVSSASSSVGAGLVSGIRNAGGGSVGSGSTASANLSTTNGNVTSATTAAGSGSGSGSSRGVPPRPPVPQRISGAFGAGNVVSSPASGSMGVLAKDVAAGAAPPVVGSGSGSAGASARSSGVLSASVVEEGYYVRGTNKDLEGDVFGDDSAVIEESNPSGKGSVVAGGGSGAVAASIGGNGGNSGTGTPKAGRKIPPPPPPSKKKGVPLGQSGAGSASASTESPEGLGASSSVVTSPSGASGIAAAAGRTGPAVGGSYGTVRPGVSPLAGSGAGSPSVGGRQGVGSANSGVGNATVTSSSASGSPTTSTATNATSAAGTIQGGAVGSVAAARSRFGG